MNAICEDLRRHIGEIVGEWERLARAARRPSSSEHRASEALADVIIGLVEASLCTPANVSAHREKVRAAAEHGYECRQRGLPDEAVLSEYHLLRQALWEYLARSFGPHRSLKAIARIDSAISIATTASLWGYNREEIRSLGKWEQGLERMTLASPLLAADGANPGTGPGQPPSSARDSRASGQETGN
jgi:hypothetical protein